MTGQQLRLVTTDGQRGLHAALELVYPTAVQCVLRDWEALLAFYQVPARDGRCVSTTNAIERAFREVRRRLGG